MAHTVDPQTQPASSDSVLSPDDYHWVEKRGDTTGRSLFYALGVTLLILSVSFTLSDPGHQWTTITLATGFIIVIALGFTSKRRKARASLPVSYHLVTTVIFLGCLFFLFYYDQTNLESLYSRLPLSAIIAFIYTRFVAPSAVKVPGRPRNHTTGRP